MQASTTAFGTIIAGNEMVLEHQIEIFLPLTRKNTCSTPSFEVGIGGWGGFFGSGLSASPVLSLSSAHAAVGTRSLRVDWQTTTASAQQFVEMAPDNPKPGAVYQVSALLWLDAASPAVTMVNVTGTSVVSTRGSWQLITGSWDAGDLSAPPFLMLNAAGTIGATNGMWVDAVLMEENGTVPTSVSQYLASVYFDGDSPSGTWLGYPGLSSSTVNIDPYPDLSLQTQSIRINRQLTTDAPAGTRLIAGYPTAEAVVVLAGLVIATDESKDAAWLFGPDSTTSPIWGHSCNGSPLTISQGVYTGTGAELIRTFTGYIDDVHVDAVTREVQVTALDPMTLFRPTVSIPPIVNAHPTAGHNPGVTAAWALEYLLRQNGINPNPPPRPGALFYASMHGSAWPEITDAFSDAVPTPHVQQSLDLFLSGSAYTNSPQDFLATLAFGVWSPQVVRYPTLTGIPLRGSAAMFASNNFNGGLNIGSGGGFFFDGYLFADSQVAGTTSLSYWGCRTNAGNNYLRIGWTWSVGGATATPTLLIKRDSGTTTKPLSGSIPISTFTHVSALIAMTGSTTATVTLTVDGTVTTTSVTGLPASGGEETFTSAAFVWQGWADTVQITNETYPTQLAAFTPDALLDPTYNPLVAIPDTTGQAAKDVVAAIAGAESAIAGFDELGVFRFRNRDTIYATTSSRSFSTASSLKALQMDDGLSTVATHIQVPAQTPTLANSQPIWAAGETIYIPRLSTYTARVTTTTPYVLPVANDSGYSGGTPPVGATYWRASRLPGGTTAVTAGITVRAAPISSTELVLTIQNENVFGVYMVSPTTLTDVPAGSPYVYVGGYSLGTANGAVGDSQWPDIEDGGSAANIEYGDIALSFSTNSWRQDLASAQALADDTLPDTYKPRPMLTNTQVIGDPRIQLGDRLTLDDSAGSGFHDDILLIGSDLLDSETDYTQTINAVRVSSPGDWIMGVAGRSEMGQTTYV